MSALHDAVREAVDNYIERGYRLEAFKWIPDELMAELGPLLEAAEEMRNALVAMNEDCIKHRITLPGEIDTVLDLVPAFDAAVAGIVGKS